MVRVLLTEDYHIVRHGLRALLETIDDVQVVGEAEDGQAAVQLVEDLGPDVLVLDMGMPRLNGIHVTTLVRSPCRLPPYPSWERQRMRAVASITTTLFEA